MDSRLRWNDVSALVLTNRMIRDPVEVDVFA